MVLPLIGLGLTAAGTIGGLLQARRGQDAAERSNAASLAFAQQNQRQQGQLGLLNYLLQRQAARSQDELARAGVVNARGDRTEYVPGIGWVERPAESTRALIGLGDNEERLRMAADAPRGRMQREDAAARMRREGQLADEMLAGMNVGSETLDGLRAALMERNLARAASGADDMRRRIGLQGLRTGQISAPMLASLARNQMLDRRTAMAEANVDAPEEFQARRANRIGPRLNQYNALAGRVGAPDAAAQPPPQIAESLTALLRNRTGVSAPGMTRIDSIAAPEFRSTENRVPVALDSLGQFLRSAGRDGQGSNWWGLFGAAKKPPALSPGDKVF